MNVTLPAIGCDDLQAFYNDLTSAQGRDVITQAMKPASVSVGYKSKNSSPQVSE